MKKVTLMVICLLVTIVGSAQAMSNSPPTIELSGNAGEYLNATIYFSDVPTDTLMGYEKWTTDGKTLNRSLKASDLGIELIYPMVVEVKDGKANINISAKAENPGNYTGAIFYRTSGQTGIAAGTWIKISVADNLSVTNEEHIGVWQSICNIWKKFWNFITGFFPTAEASNITMNTSVSVVSAPTSYEVSGGGGGGGNLQRDTDRDGICDWFEEIRGTDPNNPCDPNPNCVACLALKLSPTPTEAPKQAVVTEKKIPSRSEPVVISPLEPEKEPSLFFYGFCIALVGAGVVFLIYRLRKRALEKGEEEEEEEGEEGIEEEVEGEVYWE